MIRAADAGAMASALLEKATSLPEVRLCYLVCPSQMTAAPQCISAEVPMMTGQGVAADLARLIYSFHQWGEPIQIGLIQTGGLLQFWIEGEGW